MGPMFESDMKIMGPKKPAAKALPPIRSGHAMKRGGAPGEFESETIVICATRIARQPRFYLSWPKNA
jgi:hypothetical protein